jgi:hypothetical protein
MEEDGGWLREMEGGTGCWVLGVGCWVLERLYDCLGGEISAV